MMLNRGEPLSHFEKRVLNWMDTMVSDQKDHYEFCVEHCQHLDDQIEVVQQ